MIIRSHGLSPDRTVLVDPIAGDDVVRTLTEG